MASKHTSRGIMAKSRIWAYAIMACGTIGGAHAGTLHAPHAAPPSMLVNDAEAKASEQAFAAHPEGPAVAADKELALGGGNTLAPTLEVVQPKMNVPAHPPFDVRVIAHPHEGLGIDRNSIRIHYGFFRIDITQRMLSLGHWQGNEFIVSHADAPSGTHWFYVTVADTAGHKGNAAVEVVVSQK